MKTWSIAVIGLSCLMFSGCRADPAVALLERDNRLLEDEIYRLRGCLEDYESGMVSTSVESENKTPTRQKRRVDDDSSADTSPNSRGFPPGAVTKPPKVEMNEAPENEVPDIIRRPSGGPNRSPGPDKSPGTRNTPRSAPRLMPEVEPAGSVLQEASDSDPMPPRVPADNISYVPPPKGDSRKAVQIVLHDELCGATERDGLRVVFEPRDGHDRRVDAPAEVSVVLIDPAQIPLGSKIYPPEARIARWTFPADAVASMFRNVGGNNVIYIESPWPDKAPEQKNLKLFVRYTTRDGRELKTPGLPIEIQPTPDRTTRVKRREREQPAEEPSGPALVRDEPARDEAPRSEYETVPSENRREPIRTATRENSTRLQRPVWSPERR
jgi:hypothetical protein